MAHPFRSAALLAIIGVTLLFPALVWSQDAPLPTARFRNDLPAEMPPGEFAVSQQVLDFAPGQWTAWHEHPGQTYVTVLQGVATVRDLHDGMVELKTFTAGETWLENPGQVHRAGNEGPDQMSLMSVVLLPPGAERSPTRQGPP